MAEGRQRVEGWNEQNSPFSTKATPLNGLGNRQRESENQRKFQELLPNDRDDKHQVY
jgi:hypothetical protein